MPRQFLSGDEARRAIYIDFEGNQDRPPTLLGVLIEDRLQQFILEEAFRDCARRRRAQAEWRGHGVAREVVQAAVLEQRRIVSWSNHDHRLFLELLPDASDRTSLDRVYRNAIKTGRRWRHFVRPDLTGRHTLQSYMSVLGWKVPEEVGVGTVGPSLRYLRDRLEWNGGLWRELTISQKNKWRGVLRHNRHDLRGMRKVVCKMTDQLGQHHEAPVLRLPREARIWKP